MPALCQQLYLFEYIELPAATTTHQGLFEVRHSDSPSGASSTSAARDAGGSLAAFLCTRKAAGCTPVFNYLNHKGLLPLIFWEGNYSMIGLDRTPFRKADAAP
jgi:hypothetical protein